jgi:hypothetical protein
MFGPINPKVKDLTQFSNTWSKDQTLANRNPAGSTSQLSDSPATIWEGNGWSTSGSKSIKASYKADMQAVPASTGYGNWRLRYSLNNAAFSSALTWNPVGAASSKPLFTMHSYALVDTDNSSTVDALLSLNVRSTGSTNHIGMTTSGTVRASWSSNSSGNSEFKVAGASAHHNFYTGSSIGSQNLIAQIYGSGIYTGYSVFAGAKVTAGQADTSANSTLSTYGSLAVKGTLVTSTSYTMAETETFVYVDPSQTNVCVGTPVACTTYVSEGTCNAHTGIGCSWSVGTACSTSGSGTDSSTCTSQGAGCVWDEVTCSGANNTDQSTCENQDDTYGGSCAWDESTCGSQGDQGACEAISGCTWNFSDCTAFTNTDQSSCENNSGCTWTAGGTDCHSFDATDQGTCEANTGCFWNGDDSTCFSQCTGQYDVSCTGGLCGGTFADGNCSGNFGAGCLGGAGNCGLLASSGTCAAEAGCTWSTGITVTLPTTASASRGTTGRVYSILHVGETGTVNIVGQSGQPIFQYTSLPLFKKGDKVLLHNQNISFPCSLFLLQSPCVAQSPCAWLPVCSTLGDEESCNAVSGCGWDGDLSACTGRTTAVCSGTYSNGAHWYAHSLERGLNYVEKTANYTVTSIDDVVNCTSGTFALTLPNAALNNGKVFMLKNMGSGTITLNTTSSQTIDGNASGTLTLAQYESMSVQSNNANWLIISQV